MSSLNPTLTHLLRDMGHAVRGEGLVCIAWRLGRPVDVQKDS